MKKTININLGGQPFIIDEQAYDILHRYFEALKQKFTNENEQKEILSDIEARVGEVFAERLGKTRAVVNEEDVVYIISLMGKPEDVAGETESNATNQNTASSPTFTPGTSGRADKKFFRDPDNKKVGGVISGLCHYFGWGDPTWIRVATIGIMVLSFFGGLHLGFPIAVIYLILLIVVPEASSSAEKLQMRGQPVTIQNIEKEVRDAMTTAGNSFDSLVKNNNATGKVVSAGKTILIGLFKIFLALVIMVCVVWMLALGGLFFGFSLLSSASLTDLTHLLVSSRYTIMVFNVGLVLAIGIPIVFIMYYAIRFITNSNVKNPIMLRVLMGGWFVGILLLIFSGWNVAKNFAATDTTVEKVQLLSPKGGTLMVQLADTMGHALTIRNHDDNDNEISSLVHISGMARTDYGFAFSDIKVEIAVSPDSNFYVEKVAFSRGSNFADATGNIHQMHYKYSQTDTMLNLDEKFEIPKDGKWRGQKLKIRIYVPEGKQIAFADNIDQVETSVKGNDYFDDEPLSGKTLQVEKGKIKCPDCKEKVISDDDKDAPDPPEVPEPPNAPGIPKGPSIDVQTNGGSSHLKDVSVNINQNGVSVTGKNQNNEKVKVKVNEQGIKVITVDTNGNTTVKTK
jgi:phage shock protein PspC (stress-responsive transcriptional regulator)